MEREHHPSFTQGISFFFPSPTFFFFLILNQPLDLEVNEFYASIHVDLVSYLIRPAGHMDLDCKPPVLDGGCVCLCVVIWPCKYVYICTTVLYVCGR